MCILQVVNFAPDAQQVDVELLGLHSSPSKMTVTVLNSTNPSSENSFDEPYLVSQCMYANTMCPVVTGWPFVNCSTECMTLSSMKSSGKEQGVTLSPV